MIFPVLGFRVDELSRFSTLITPLTCTAETLYGLRLRSWRVMAGYTEYPSTLKQYRLGRIVWAEGLLGLRD
jgi:hypothetical protein